MIGRNGITIEYPPELENESVNKIIMIRVYYNQFVKFNLVSINARATSKL